MNRLTLFIPFALCLALGAFLFFSLGKDPLDLPSALVDEAFPEFALEELHEPERQLSTDDFDGQVLLVNVWATWCFACRIEHQKLNSLAEQGVVIVGLNYKDQRAEAKLWLYERGNPYQFNIFDAEGSLGIDLGVYGAPETYLVDGDGIIRHRRVGVVDDRIWDAEFKALYQELTGVSQ